MRSFPRRGPDRSDAGPSGMRELQVPPPDRPRLGRVDRARRLCEADEEAGPHGRRTKAPHPLETGRRPRGGLREAGRVREFGLRRRPDDREQDPREDARYREGVPERSLRGEAEIRHDAAVLERAAGEAEAVLTPAPRVIGRAIRDLGAEVAMLKYVEVIGSAYHDPNRHEEQTDTARGGLPRGLKAHALVVCALADWRGHGVRAAPRP